PFSSTENSRQTQQTRIAPAKPEAVAAYRQGMELISRPQGYQDFPGAERLFKRAAALDLPHAHYGMACLLYAQTDWQEHIPQILGETKTAAEQGVIEAKAFLAWLARDQRFGFTETQFRKLWEEAANLAQKPGIVSGAPGTVEFESP